MSCKTSDCTRLLSISDRLLLWATAMSEAVEGAEVMLFGVSEKYKER